MNHVVPAQFLGIRVTEERRKKNLSLSIHGYR